MARIMGGVKPSNKFPRILHFLIARIITLPSAALISAAFYFVASLF